MEISEIYAPVQADLVKVEDTLKSLCRVDFPHLAGLLDYSLGSVGKRIRPILTLLAGKFYKYDIEHILPMAAAVEILHTATLVHDDAVDKSSTRRGRATVNSLWGEEQAILSAGEISQALNAYNLKLTREQYFERMAKKTAALFVLSTEAGAVLSQAPEESIQILNEFGYNLGLAFQVVDDILDFIGTKEELGKPIGADLMQGTFTLPAMLLRQYYPEDDSVKNLFQGKDRQDGVKQAIELVRNSPVIIEECYQTASAFCSMACRNLKQLPDNPSRKSLFELADYVVRRKT